MSVLEPHRFGLVRKTWTGLRQEALTPSGHHAVEFSGSVAPPARTLVVIMPAIVLELTRYTGPFDRPRYGFSSCRVSNGCFSIPAAPIVSATRCKRVWLSDVG